MKRVFSAFHRAKQFYEEHERFVSITAMVIGFIIDNLTLRRVDLLAENLILIAYLLICAFAIIHINIYDVGRLEGRAAKWLRLISPVLLQFAFGGLFSAFFVFYFRSASVGASWPFILFLFVMMLGNEVFSKKFEHLTFQISVFFIAILSFSIFYLPIVFHSIGTGVFISSIIFSLLLTGAFLWIVGSINIDTYNGGRKFIFSSVSTIVVLVSLAYFFNVIPPIPLSVKEKIVAYNISRLSGGDYRIFAENRPWYEDLFGRQVVYISNGSPLYLFSSVFAPTQINTDIVHEWQVKTDEGWQTASRISFPVVGGADRGYRGYSVKYNLYPGQWRVNIETPRGATIGRLNFTVVSTDILPEVQEVIYY